MKCKIGGDFFWNLLGGLHGLESGFAQFAEGMFNRNMRIGICLMLI